MTTLLTIKNLKTHFYSAGKVVRALDGVSLEIEEGGAFGWSERRGVEIRHSPFHFKAHPYPPGKIVGGEIHFKGKISSNFRKMRCGPSEEKRSP